MLVGLCWLENVFVLFGKPAFCVKTFAVDVFPENGLEKTEVVFAGVTVVLYMFLRMLIVSGDGFCSILFRIIASC